MTTQSPHLYARQPRPAAARPGRSARTATGGDRTGPGRAAGAQTRLPWWALVLPALAFAVLLALLTGGTAGASSAAPAGDWFARLAVALPGLARHLP